VKGKKGVFLVGAERNGGGVSRRLPEWRKTMSNLRIPLKSALPRVCSNKKSLRRASESCGENGERKHQFGAENRRAGKHHAVYLKREIPKNTGIEPAEKEDILKQAEVV